jgi:hypothetical protein
MALWTAWRVASAPPRLISVMAHLVAKDGHVVATGDGLGVPIESWSVGDFVIQAHRLNIPRDTAPGMYQIAIGIYTLDDLKKFPILIDGKLAGEQLFLTGIQVK